MANSVADQVAETFVEPSVAIDELIGTSQKETEVTIVDVLSFTVHVVIRRRSHKESGVIP